ncbi:DUF4129 domain-containing protein [Rhodanobacter sp. C03]|uniref:DUF4129 domain-containing protein n=1 Tax=Rhodanobacter sp. C03 TaxID=1945858 RepID=UPI000986206D|nr:DUF4129 domain-containing protein [Rhodanobacter sp. C03]OOG60380.1 DUF4129 domain-containing protein [Rhodanobacter sp. C03]
MELERISVVLRPRAPREALDLGATMLRANARAVWSAWFAFTLPVFVTCNALGVALGLPWLGLVLMWWLKPLFDRLPLYVLSRAVFDRAPGWRETLRGQGQWPWGSTWAALSWLRIDSNRSLRLPLELLEGLPRRQRAARWSVLRRRIVTDASLLTYGCLQFELVLFLSVWLLAMLLIPREWLPDSLRDFFRVDVHAASTIWMLLTSLVAYLAMSVIEPLYVACGFALYLNRRTQLEAWDIDLAFRRLRQRLQASGKTLAVLLACACCWPLSSHAASSSHGSRVAPPTSLEQVFKQPVDGADQQRFAAAATEVYRDPRFGGEHKAREWVFKYASTPQPVRTPMQPLFPGFAALVAMILKLGLWLLLAVVVGALLRFVWRWQRTRVVVDAAPVTPAPTWRAQVMADTPLPSDLAGAIRTLWGAQQQREALALLYRGCVEQTARLLQLPASIDATEADWLRQAAAMADPARAQRVIAIVRTWQFAAYAGRYPDDVVVESLLVGWPAQAGAPA